MDEDVESVRIGTPSLLDISPGVDVYLPASLEELERTSHIFIRKHDEKRLDGSNGFVRFFDILNSQGTRIYTGIERTPKDLLKLRGQNVFTVSILDLKEIEMIRIIGRLGEKYSTFQGDRLWGGVEAGIHKSRDIYPIFFVKQGNPKSSLKTSKDDRLTEILYIVGDQVENNSGCCGQCKISDGEVRRMSHSMAFEGKIYLPDRVSCVGRMGSEWSAVDSIECNENMVKDCVGIQFPGQTDMRIKSIMLGAPFFLNPNLFTS